MIKIYRKWIRSTEVEVEELSISEIAELPWYDMLSYMGLESFNWSGMESWDDLMGLCNFPERSQILMIGCGVGKSTFYLAEKYPQYSFLGIDLAETSIEMAKEKVHEQNLTERVQFQIADAHKLPFEDNTFDGVFTEFMAYFLDHPVALKEFFRVLKPGGNLGLNELMKDSAITEEANLEFLRAEKIFKEVSGYPLKVPRTDEYEHLCEEVGFKEWKFLNSKHRVKIREYFKLAGGVRKFLKIMNLMLKLYKHSKAIKDKFKKQKEVKKIIMFNRSTRKFIFPAVARAQKPTKA
ncbi:MAG: class I SAM-dependent methyltransferase [Promethearchaeota archaeon]